MKKLFLMLCFLWSTVSLMASGSISGTVTTALSVPLPGATVTLLQGTSTVVATTTTASNGTYSFSAVTAGDYVVRSSLLTFQTGVAGVTVIDGQNSSANFALGANPGAISGQVLDNTSHLAIVGATVRAIQNNVLIGSATTDGSGNYTINGLSAGAYVLSAAASGHQEGTAGATVLASMTTTANFSLLASPGTVSGTVTSASGGLPIVSALVQVSSGGTVLYSALTNGSGNYTITGVAAGSYTVTAIAAGYTTDVAGATVTAGGTTTANFSLQVSPGTVSGTVISASGGTAISGAQVEVKLGSIVVGSAVSDNAGGYSIPGIAPGTYVVNVYATGYQTGTVGAIVVSNSTSTANFSLQLNPGTISGTVTKASGGLPIVSALVQVIDNDSVIGSGLTDSSGNFTIAGIAPGSYTVSAMAATFQEAVQGAAVSSDLTTTVNFALAASPGTISGAVTSAMGSIPISGALVEVVLNNTILFSAVTDSSGDYSISGIAPGVYVVNISASGYQTGVAGAIVTASTTTTVSVSLQTAPGTVSGTVQCEWSGANFRGTRGSELGRCCCRLCRNQ